MTRHQRNRTRRAREARAPVCSYPLGCSAPALKGWHYCAQHHARVVRRGQELARLQLGREGGGHHLSEAPPVTRPTLPARKSAELSEIGERNPDSAGVMALPAQGIPPSPRRRAA